MENDRSNDKDAGVFLPCLISLGAGLALFQLLASLSVHASNRHLVQTMTRVMDQGYLAVPGATILPGLETFRSAFAGGLFFTFTVGALVCLTALAAALTDMALGRNGRPGLRKAAGAGFFGLLILLAVAVNLRGILLFETVSLVLCPLLVFFTCQYALKDRPFTVSRTRIAIHAGLPVLLALILLFFPHSQGSRFFTDFRDTFLMTNPVGMAVNDFYYTHTLSPAEVFKSLEQKQIRTCRLILAEEDRPQESTLRDILVSRDFLPLDGQENPHLTLRSQEGNLRFYRADDLVMEARIIDVIAGPDDLLKRFSQKTDVYGSYRKLTGTALLTGLPLLAYLLMHSLFFTIFRLFSPRTTAGLAASGACFLLALSGFIVLFFRASAPLPPGNVRAALHSSSLHERVKGLQTMEERRMDAAYYPVVLESMASPFPLERYWAARAVAGSRDAAVFARLIELTRDSQPNVACQAFYALGMGGHPDAVPEIRQSITEATNWYVQWYAYKALRRLGWTQPLPRP